MRGKQKQQQIVKTTEAVVEAQMHEYVFITWTREYIQHIIATKWFKKPDMQHTLIDQEVKKRKQQLSAID